ncbi:efflux RND transporter periplasmic adaptor subunit [uncultured Sphaerochaeta sp.]|uniref:efflux RND transporter periplasmic adaptor subunit n=1 Tax=uncultured Sphaerochaeta sp. TaxID=886478 RepID=UPI002A0A47B7|nr:efflux RND transporter periplasmic adaptor subunit [uncultured Sphaerochaeta sp.]
MEKKSSFDKIVTIILVAICIVLAAIVGNNLINSSKGQTQGPLSEVKKQDNIINVSVESVTSGPFTKYTTLGAELENSIASISLTSTLTGGKLTALSIKEGDVLKAGDIIGTVDPSTPGNQYKPSSITATTGGTVSSVDAYIGEQITTSTGLATLVEAGDLQIIAYLPERYLSTIEVGSKAIFTTAAWPEEQEEATVTLISPTINSSNRTFKVTLSLDKNNPKLKEGMYVTLKLVTEKIDSCLTISTDAITTYLGKPVVYIAVDNKAKRVSITTSSSDDTKSVVTSGLTGDEKIIVAGSVVDGSAIKIIEE